MDRTRSDQFQKENISPLSQKGEEMKQAAWRLEKLSKEESLKFIEEAKEKARMDRTEEIEQGQIKKPQLEIPLWKKDLPKSKIQL